MIERSTVNGRIVEIVRLYQRGGATKEEVKEVMAKEEGYIGPDPLQAQCQHCWRVRMECGQWRDDGEFHRDMSHTACPKCIETNPLYASVRDRILRKGEGEDGIQ